MNNGGSTTFSNAHTAAGNRAADDVSDRYGIQKILHCQ